MAIRPAPANRLSVEEEQQIRAACHHLEYASLPPSQIVPRLADVELQVPVGFGLLLGL
ncbi:hypothetical protein NGK83_13750 [Serratia fonticola]|nr:hypothetical protein [Serratia fonticola]ERK15265.1 Mobile element protein [Serratia fonticola AU-P3(3)]MEB7885623.1 hypothetical protein [Serratia fonticola]